MIYLYRWYMRYKIDDIYYEVVIEKKNNKNTYIRVKDDLKIYVTTNYFTSSSSILKLLDENISSIKKMIDKRNISNSKKEDFYLFGKKYDVVITNTSKPYIENDVIYVKDRHSLDLWLKKEIKELYKIHLDKIYNTFEENIPYPKLKIRDMKTRWGVNNRRDNSITLNSKLVRYDLEALDYVIIHELSHFVHFNHSKSFWDLVSKYEPNYKKIRKDLKE